MKTPYCSQCGREVRVYVKRGFKGYRRCKDHDLCERCFGSVMEQANQNEKFKEAV